MTYEIKNNAYYVNGVCLQTGQWWEDGRKRICIRELIPIIDGRHAICPIQAVKATSSNPNQWYGTNIPLEVLAKDYNHLPLCTGWDWQPELEPQWDTPTAADIGSVIEVADYTSEWHKLVNYQPKTCRTLAGISITSSGLTYQTICNGGSIPATWNYARIDRNKYPVKPCLVQEEGIYLYANGLEAEVHRDERNDVAGYRQYASTTVLLEYRIINRFR